MPNKSMPGKEGGDAVEDFLPRVVIQMLDKLQAGELADRQLSSSELRARAAELLRAVNDPSSQ